MPDQNSTQNIWVGKNKTQNQPGILVESASSGLFGLRVVLVGFGFCHQGRDLVGFVEI